MRIGFGLALGAFIMVIGWSDSQAQSWAYRVEYQYAKEDMPAGRSPQSEDEVALKAFREFRYSLIRSLKRGQNTKELQPLENYWKDVKPY